MKMIIAILNSDDASTVMHNLMKEGYQITKLSTTGGFLRAGNVTVLIGVEDDKLEHCLEMCIRDRRRPSASFVPAISLPISSPSSCAISGRKKKVTR